jgi:hypothetical protein
MLAKDKARRIAANIAKALTEPKQKTEPQALRSGLFEWSPN